MFIEFEKSVKLNVGSKSSGIMKKSVKIAVSLFILCIIISGIFLLNKKTIIALNGKEELILTVNSKYEELGASSKTGSPILGYHDNNIKIEGNVDTSKVGEYYITYKANNQEVKRKVVVIDKLPPVITSKDEITISCPGTELKEFNDYEISDNYDTEITKKVDINHEEKKITINAVDSSGNSSTKEIKINYLDNEKPKLTLKGDNYIILKKGEKYEEAGYTVTDNCDTNLNDVVKITNNVDITKAGDYTVTYEVKDLSGNKEVLTRKVIVYVPADEKTIVPNGKTIYLTFDDGPGPYTEKLLDTLKEYNVKATFFVTGQFPKYFYVLKRIHEEGHTIGIHTYSHKWSIYSSMETYLSDFDKIKNVVVEHTGEEPKIMRFPGGSSNTVSKKYNKGIMTKLSVHMKERGIKYFDWNIASSDTTTSNSNTIANNVIKSLGSKDYYIVLQHDIKKASVNAVPKIIEYARSKGYQFDSLDETSPVIQFKVNN